VDEDEEYDSRSMFYNEFRKKRKPKKQGCFQRVIYVSNTFKTIDYFKFYRVIKIKNKSRANKIKLHQLILLKTLFSQKSKETMNKLIQRTLIMRRMAHL
jgi:hypothetical protein